MDHVGCLFLLQVMVLKRSVTKLHIINRPLVSLSCRIETLLNRLICTPIAVLLNIA